MITSVVNRPARPHPPDSVADKLVGIPYRHEWLPAAHLEIGASYQRAIDQAWVKRLAASFDPFLLDDLLINRTPAGRHVVMDGQHRLLAIREMGWGDQNVPCKVYDNLPEDLQAKRFNVQDVRRKLTAQARFKAKLIAGDKGALMIRAAVEQAGFQINLDNNGGQDGGRIPAIGALVRIEARSGANLIREALDLMAAAWGTERGPAYPVILGVTSFLTRYRDQFDRGRLLQVLRQTTHGHLMAEGHEIRRALATTHDAGIVYAIWKAYNHRLSEAKRLPDPSAARTARLRARGS